MTDNGGELTGNFKNGEINKITEWIGLSYCVNIREYYFYNGELIFVKETEENFPYVEATGSLDHTRLEPAFEGHYYFNNQKLVEAKTTGQKRFPEDLTAQEIESALLTTAKQNIELLLSGTLRHS